jgi:hypothetical protein
LPNNPARKAETYVNPGRYAHSKRPGSPTSRHEILKSPHSAEETPIPLNAEDLFIESGPSLDELIARANIGIKQYVAWVIIGLFFFTNLAVFCGLALVWHQDIELLRSHVLTPADRLITSGVIQTLIGATAVQGGAFALVIARHLFPSWRISKAPSGKDKHMRGNELAGN